MTRQIYIAGVNDAADVRFPEGFTTSSAAEQGTVSIGTIEIDDPNGTYDLKNLNAAYIVETAASPQRIWTGYLYNLTIERGHYTSGAGRVWKAECLDVNRDLMKRIVLSSNGNRGVETDLVRVAWLLANPVLSGLVVSGTRTNLSTGAANLDAANYYWQRPMEVLADIAPQCGKVAFAFYNESTAAVELFYDLATASTYDSTAKISNVAADAGAGVYPPYMDAVMERVGENIASKEVLRWVGGITTQENTTTKSTYGEYVDTWESSRVGRSATAASQVAAVLANRAAPEDTVTVRVEVPAANVNDILEGQRIQVKFSHLPGWGQAGSYVYARVIRRAVAQLESAKYLLQLTLSNKVRAPLGGGSAVGGFPTPTPGPTHFYSGSLTFHSDGYGSAGGGAIPVPGPAPNQTDATDNTTLPTFLAGQPYDYSFTMAQTGGDNPPQYGLATAAGAWTGAGSVHSTGVGSGTQTFTGTFTPVADFTAYATFSTGALGHPAGGRATVCSWIIDPVGWAPTPASTPLPGRPVPPAGVTPAPDGVTVIFTTAYSYADGSLHVEMNGSRLDPGVDFTETSGEAGTFTFTRAPLTNAQIVVWYQGR